MKSLSFFVQGLPQTAGSKRGFAIKRGGHYTGRVAITDDNPKSRSWKNCVAFEAKQAVQAADASLMLGAVAVRFVFSMPRPKAHFGTGKNSSTLKDSAPKNHTIKPDVLKLSRAVEDALTGIVWRDDAQIVCEEIHKAYAPRPGVMIVVREL